MSDFRSSVPESPSEQLLRRLIGPLVDVCLKAARAVTKNRQLSDGLAHDAMAIYWRHFERLHTQQIAPYPWLQRVVMYLNAARLRQLLKPELTDVDLPQLVARARPSVPRGAIFDAAAIASMAGLCRAEQDVISLQVEFGLSECEIADLLNLPEDAVIQHIDSACRKLRNLLGPEYPEQLLRESGWRRTANVEAIVRQGVLSKRSVLEKCLERNEDVQRVVSDRGRRMRSSPPRFPHA